MTKENTIKIEVAYALPDEQVILAVEVAEGTTVEDGIKASGILERYPEIDLAQTKVGIFSRITPLSSVLQVGDRIEIYRPLLIDPKAKRKERAEKQKNS